MKDRYLYTYIPKHNTVAYKGILGTRNAPRSSLEKYRERVANSTGKDAASITRGDILDWLDSTAPGRSSAVSVLTEPIPSTANADLVAFARRSRLYRLPSAARLRSLGLIDKIYKTRVGRRGLDMVDDVDYSPVVWQEKTGKGGLLFNNTRHYIIPLNKGNIPARYVEEVL